MKDKVKPQEVEEVLKKEETALTNRSELSIAGLEDLPSSIIPVPFVRLVQPTSTNIEISPGKEAQAGEFLFDDTKTTTQELKFTLLRAKSGTLQFERNNEVVSVQKIALLGITLDNEKLFILNLSPTSFSNFGRLVAQMKEKKVECSWKYSILATSEKQENEKGKYYVVKFFLSDELPEEKVHQFEVLAKEYRIVLDRKQPTE